ncbi:MAG: transcriptional regulator, TetR family protein [Microbacteriaceae bacterium]|jgi:AcrR family transcriptional regulator|nr:transcriptional regulator, TetR family protein [Microbacteriaceae bacterium]
MGTDISGASLRRVPRQDRSEQRFELILDTTATLIDEVGYGNLTTSLIAKRVGMSGPGIYRYFDGLQAIARALATRNLQRLLERAAELTSDTSLEWNDAMNGLVTVYSEMFRTEPGFRWLRLGDAIDRHLIDESETNRTVVAKVMAKHFVDRYDVSHRDDLLQHVEVMVEIADSLIARAFVSNLDGDEFFISETSRLLTNYLGEYLASTVEEAEERERRARL